MPNSWNASSMSVQLCDIIAPLPTPLSTCANASEYLNCIPCMTEIMTVLHLLKLMFTLVHNFVVSSQTLQVFESQLGFIETFVVFALDFQSQWCVSSKFCVQRETLMYLANSLLLLTRFYISSFYLLFYLSKCRFTGGIIFCIIIHSGTRL
jgi:hypothetical protein